MARRYVGWLLGLVILASGSVFALNMLVDPLWYVGGNKLTGINYAFNERISKSNLFLEDPERWDCVILGSSRTTLLNAARIEGARCFNFAVSQGTLEDFEVILRWVAARTELQRVIVGLDGYQFAEQAPEGGAALPPFLRQGAGPPDLLASQLSVDTLDFTIRTLRRLPPNDRYYDADFVTRVVPGAGSWQAPETIEIDGEGRRGGFAALPPGPFRPSATERLARLRAIAPDAELVAYVPPVNAWYAAELSRTGTLESYLETMEAGARHFDALYDFTAPSVLTRDPTLTYDGHHYVPKANDRVAATLNARGGPLALAVHALPVQRYRARYERKVQRFVADTPVRFVEASGR